MTNYQKGSRVEREWQEILDRSGHLVTRAAGSGKSKTSHFDLHSTNRNGASFLWEIKSTRGNTRWFSEDECKRLDLLVIAADTHNCSPWLVVKYPNAEFKVYHPYDVLGARKAKVSDPWVQLYDQAAKKVIV